MNTRLKLSQITKTYGEGQGVLNVLTGVDLELESGTSLSIMGPSGSGKSTLLHIIGTLDRPSAGTLAIDGQDPLALDDKGLARFRNNAIGFVFQDHHLLPQYTALENVLLPCYAFPAGPDREPRARELLERVGLKDRLAHRPAELSGGERQRVAIARALIQAPKLLLCDEPTGNLDGATADSVTQLLLTLHREERNILVVVTHSEALAASCARPMVLRAGKLELRHG